MVKHPTPVDGNVLRGVRNALLIELAVAVIIVLLVKACR